MRFGVIVFLLFLSFCLGQIWKAHEIAQFSSRLDSLRSRQQGLGEELLTVHLALKESLAYSRIEPLARSRLGMHPSPQPPVVIAPLDERLIALQRESLNRTSRGDN